MNDILISLVIPAYNETKRIKATLNEVYNYFSKQKYNWEVIISDDGSIDNTTDIVKAFIKDHEGFKIKNNLHKGKANAVREGVLSAKGKYIIFTDADLATPISEVDKALDHFKHGADVIIGSREEGTRKGEPKLRHIMGRVYNRLIQLILIKGIKDTQAGFKGFTNEAANKIFNSLIIFGPNQKIIKRPAVTGFDIEVILVAQKLGYKISVIPINWIYRPDTKVSPIRDSLRMVMEIIKVKIAHF